MVPEPARKAGVAPEGLLSNLGYDQLHDFYVNLNWFLLIIVVIFQLILVDFLSFGWWIAVFL